MRPWDSADAGHVRISGRGGGTAERYGSALPLSGGNPRSAGPSARSFKSPKTQIGRPARRPIQSDSSSPSQRDNHTNSTSPQRQRQASRPDHGRGPASRSARNPRRLQAPDAAAGGRPADARRSTRRCRWTGRNPQPPPACRRCRRRGPPARGPALAGGRGDSAAHAGNADTPASSQPRSAMADRVPSIGDRSPRSFVHTPVFTRWEPIM